MRRQNLPWRDVRVQLDVGEPEGLVAMLD